MAATASLPAQRRRFLVVLPGVLLLVVAFAVLMEPQAPLGLRQAVSALGLLVAGLFAAVSCAQRRRQTTGRRRRSWQLLVSAAVVAIAGNVWVVLVGADPVSSPSVVGNTSIAVALLLSIIALLRFPTVRRRGVDQLLMVLDGLVAAAAVLVVASVLVYGELLDSVHGDVVTRVTTLLFPVLDVVLATVALLLILRTSGADRSALAFVSAGFLMYAVADLSFAVLAAQGRFHFGTYLDLGWIVGYLLIGLAAWYPSDRSDEAVVPSAGGSSDARGTVLLFAVLLVAGVVQVTFGPGGRFTVPQALLWLVLILAAGVRQLLLAVDNARLRRGLELQVAEQTADLRRLARQNEVLLTSVGDGIYGVDPDGRVTFVNPSGARALQWSPGQLLGRSAHDVFHAPPADGTPFDYRGCYVHEAIAARIVAHAEEDVYLRADGTTFPVEITASPLVDDDQVRGAVVVFRDVTQRREVDRMKDEFLSVVSHELRTPLTSIRGSLGLLSGGKLGELPPRAGPLVTIAMQNSERLTRLINDLLDIERLDSGNRPLELVPHGGAALLRTAATALEGLATASRVRLDVHGCPGEVLADEDLVMQTLTNLLGNAIKYSPADGVVELGCEHRGDYMLFRVEDHGRGIPADKLESVFERFQQVDSSDSRQMGGTGLGLAISRGIIDRHGGRIWAESELGRGTRVLFTLPTPGPTPGPTAGPTPGDEAFVPAPRRAADRRRVLVVDRDEARAQRTAELLAGAGLDAYRATSAPEAVVKGRELRPHALLLDLDLPGAETEVLAAWRADPALTDAALVAHTAAEVAPGDRARLGLGHTALLTAGAHPAAELRQRLLEVVESTTERRQGHTHGGL